MHYPFTCTFSFHSFHTCVLLQIEQDILNSQSEKEYAGILGYPSFHKAAAEFALTKDSQVIKENRVIAWIFSIRLNNIVAIIIMLLVCFSPGYWRYWCSASDWSVLG